MEYPQTMWSHKIKTYEEDLEHFVIQEHTNKNVEEFGWREIFGSHL